MLEELQKHGAYILVTSRVELQSCLDGAHKVPLTGLSQEAGMELLKDRSSDVTWKGREHQLKRIAEQICCGNPQLICLVAGMLTTAGRVTPEVNTAY